MKGKHPFLIKRRQILYLAKMAKVENSKLLNIHFSSLKFSMQKIVMEM